MIGLIRKRKSFLLFWIRKVGLALILTACLIALVVHFNSVRDRESNLPGLDFGSMDTVERQAWQLAEEMVGAGRDMQGQFVTELLDIYYQVKDSDFAIFCISGGWGKGPLSADPQGQSWLAGIGAKLKRADYKYCMIDYVRTDGGLAECLFEAKELLTGYPSKAKQLSAKIDFLTRQIGGLKIIITGQSNGAAFANRVVGYLADDPDVYSIQIGCPFWCQAPEVGQSLVIRHNGVGGDTLTERDLTRLFKANFMKLFVIGYAPSFTPIDWLITRAVLIFLPYEAHLGLEAPGHEYMWEYPGVGPQIEAFLTDNFDAR